MIRLFLACVLLCAFLISPADAQSFLDGVVSINVTMTKEETCIASQYRAGMAITAAGRPQASGSTPTP
ncbi:hypothetical protein [Tardiphaga sp. 11_C7_N12_6]|uniref:hypothetical protein n=1 Tax=Tardiphaga sp. 11_C7_N12_6 TaxID=3240789 RepID=UPI003F1FA86D